jgi:formylglycine-generating enzyme required for sulfatase activity
MELLEPDFYADGLHGAPNMSGNVQQWVADWLDDTYYKTSPAKNPNINYLSCF